MIEESPILIDVAVCERCQASAHEEVDERKGDVILACCFCGMRVRVNPRALRRQVSRPPEEFRFRSGRFRDLSFAEVDAQPNGRKYLEWLHAHDAKLRDKVAAYLYSS